MDDIIWVSMEVLCGPREEGLRAGGAAARWFSHLKSGSACCCAVCVVVMVAIFSALVSSDALDDSAGHVTRSGWRTFSLKLFADGYLDSYHNNPFLKKMPDD